MADRFHHCGFFAEPCLSTDQDVLHISRIVLEAARKAGEQNAEWHSQKERV